MESQSSQMEGTDRHGGQGEPRGRGRGDVSIAAQPATLPEMVYRLQRGCSPLVWNTPTLQRVFGVKRNLGFNLNIVNWESLFSHDGSERNTF